MIQTDSNEGLLRNINNQVNRIKENIDIDINILSNNIKLLKEKYYNLFYLLNYNNWNIQKKLFIKLINFTMK